MTDLGHTFNPFFEVWFYSLICITSPEQGRQRELTTTLKPHQYKSINQSITKRSQGHEEVYLSVPTEVWTGFPSHGSFKVTAMTMIFCFICFIFCFAVCFSVHRRRSPFLKISQQVGKSIKKKKKVQ